MRKTQRKLTLSRETLVGLDTPDGRFELAVVLGGAGTASYTQLKEDCCISKTTH